MIILFILLKVVSDGQNSTGTSRLDRTIPALGPTSARPESPDIVLRLQNGEGLRLPKVGAKVIYLNFWASWCAPCIDELPILDQWQRQLGTEKFMVILINQDHSTDAVLGAMEKQKRLAPNLMGVYVDTENLQKSFNVQALPYHFIIDGKGRTALTFYASLKSFEGQVYKIVTDLITEVSTLQN